MSPAWTVLIVTTRGVARWMSSSLPGIRLRLFLKAGWNCSEFHYSGYSEFTALEACWWAVWSVWLTWLGEGCFLKATHLKTFIHDLCLSACLLLLWLPLKLSSGAFLLSACSSVVQSAAVPCVPAVLIANATGISSYENGTPSKSNFWKKESCVFLSCFFFSSGLPAV